MILTALATGVLLGLAAGFTPGPLTVLVISTTLAHSAVDGLKIAMGPLLTDAPIVVVSLLVMAGLENQAAVLGGIALAGALFVLYLGYKTMKVRPPRTDAPAGDARALRKGALVNLLSPHPYLFWLTVGAPQTVLLSQEGWGGGAAFMASFYICLVGSKMSMAWVAAKARPLIAGPPYLWVMRGLGALLAGLALLLARQGLTLLGLI